MLIIKNRSKYYFQKEIALIEIPGHNHLMADKNGGAPHLTPMLESTVRLKLPVLPQVGPNYIGMWVISTPVVTSVKIIHSRPITRLL